MRQVVHHVPDSHLNAYTRVKLALTEDKPTIKPSLGTTLLIGRLRFPNHSATTITMPMKINEPATT